MLRVVVQCRGRPAAALARWQRGCTWPGPQHRAALLLLPAQSGLPRMPARLTAAVRVIRLLSACHRGAWPPARQDVTQKSDTLHVSTPSAALASLTPPPPHSHAPRQHPAAPASTTPGVQSAQGCWAPLPDSPRPMLPQPSAPVSKPQAQQHGAPTTPGGSPQHCSLLPPPFLPLSSRPSAPRPFSAWQATPHLGEHRSCHPLPPPAAMWEGPPAVAPQPTCSCL